ncbi:hypothetical protein CYMTET_28723 [Cymbomonas tetramitiformis]|uniref:F5/8 type C domain-containing protein n=1 Tax=Cymbomonas tetramitiformis TaxID=36881 RepID=A0AAE0FM84_9CHLO|nr:hypothetical protein CYMTET_28723 [Cymbomonas tetramitiformis]
MNVKRQHALKSTVPRNCCAHCHNEEKFDVSQHRTPKTAVSPQRSSLEAPLSNRAPNPNLTGVEGKSPEHAGSGMQLKQATPAEARLCVNFSPESWPKPSQANLPAEWDWVSASDSSDGEWEDLAERPFRSGETARTWREVVLMRPILPASRTINARACEELSSNDAASCVKEEIYGRFDEGVHDDACSCHSCVWTEPWAEPDLAETVELTEAEEAFPLNSEYLAKLKQLRGRAWSEDDKLRCLHGASATRRPYSRRGLDILRQTEVVRAPHNTEDGDVLYPVTELELELGVHQQNLNKRRAWERCAELIGETGTERKGPTHREDLAEVSFSLPTVGFLVMPSAESMPASRRRRSAHRSFMLHEAQRQVRNYAGTDTKHHLKPVCNLMHSEVPAAMKLPRLPARLRTRAATSFNFSKALLQNGNAHTHCWVPGPKRHCLEDDGDFLEVDLGGECVVHGVGTRGLFPTYFWYPTAEVIEKEMGLKLSEYHGGFQAVVKEDSPMGWVKKYELLYRTERGTEWISLGIFEGNTNYHEESVTSMLPFAFPGISGIRVRYLRLRPLSKAEEGYHLKKALRVAIYGHPVSRKASASTRNHRAGDRSVAAVDTAEKSPSAAAPASNESATNIAYTLRHAAEHRNPIYVKRTGGHSRCRCNYCATRIGRTARKKVNGHAAREAIEWIGRAHLGVPVSLIDQALALESEALDCEIQEDECSEWENAIVSSPEPRVDMFAGDTDLELAQSLSLSMYEHEQILKHEEQGAFEMALELSRNERR